MVVLLGKQANYKQIEEYQAWYRLMDFINKE